MTGHPDLLFLVRRDTGVPRVTNGSDVPVWTSGRRVGGRGWPTGNDRSGPEVSDVLDDWRLERPEGPT